MGFYEYWHEQEFNRLAEYQACVELASSWVGRRVWIRSVECQGAAPSYGEVEFVDERGMVRILVGYAPDGHPWYQTVSANMLGTAVVLADES